LSAEGATLGNEFNFGIGAKTWTSGAATTYLEYKPVCSTLPQIFGEKSGLE